jgi:hypothetical protein
MEHRSGTAGPWLPTRRRSIPCILLAAIEALADEGHDNCEIEGGESRGFHGLEESSDLLFGVEAFFKQCAGADAPLIESGHGLAEFNIEWSDEFLGENGDSSGGGGR